MLLRRDEQRVVSARLVATSSQFLELERLPRRIVLVGGGYIGFEFAHIAARAGAQVEIVHRGTRPLPRFEPELVAWLVEASREIGISVDLATEVTALERKEDELLVHVSDALLAIASAG